MGISNLVRPFALAACVFAALGGGASAKEKAAKPSLVVVVSVDQFSAQLFERYRPSFKYGLKRMSQGKAFASGYQSHAATETCPGHSTIMTGRYPANAGIIANTWFNKKNGSNLYCVSVTGTSDPDARGPQRLLADTMGDWLKAASPGARVYSVSGKDRAAIMMAGHHADGVYWWVDGTGFATSSYAGPATDDVLKPAQDFNAAVQASWRAAPPTLWPVNTPKECASLQAPHKFGQEEVSGKVPPDMAIELTKVPNFSERDDFQALLKASPLFDALTLDFAGKLLADRQLGKGANTDLLTISLSATDYVGHRYGNGGAEECAQVLATDKALGGFFDKLDATGVHYVVALTADHGGMDAAERAAEKGVAAERIDGGAIISGLNADLRKTLALEYDPLISLDPQQIYINTVPGDDQLVTKVRDESVKWLREQKQVADVFTAEQIAATPMPTGKTPDKYSLIERYRLSYKEGRSADIAVAYKEFSTLGTPRMFGDVVAGHGTPWDYDRRVPILFWWPHVKMQNRVEPIEVVDIAPTLADFIGLKTPGVDGKCLKQVAGCTHQ